MESPRLEIHIWNYTPEEIKQKIDDFKKDQRSKLNFYCAEEYEFNEDLDRSSLPESKNINFIFGSSDINFYKDLTEKFNVYLWYNYFLYQAYDVMDITEIIENKIPSKLFISLNNRAHRHRCVMMDLLCKNDLINKGIISWHRADPSPYAWGYWTPKYLRLGDNFERSKYQHCLPKQFNDAFLNLVAESTIDTIFITEKTWHPILIAKPFLVLGAVGFHKFLESKGFKLYDEIFDYSFDYEPNLEKRTSMILDQIDQLKDKDLHDLYLSVKKKLYYNKNLSLDMIRTRTGVPSIAMKFNDYLELVKRAICKLDL
jgi:hypothetical protein